ncbi:hypothetical protein HNY73_005108 [Argiope bruennichi]|uniref:Uncharacterized protein n=1 Tax=Argiope bruennichi TaxID=94029 RepID=A0A8T0FKW5_ARGBR|nr:hypothetical protein HNY73_005108 [Argiope bruennichi]
MNINVEEKNIQTELIVLKNARGNISLLGVDFLRAAGIVLDLKKGNWYFSEYPQIRYHFIKSPHDINTLHTKSHPCQLRVNEGTNLSSEQKERLNSLLEEYETCFQLEGEPTPFIEHKIDSSNYLPVAIPSYRLSPARQEILKKEVDAVLAAGVILIMPHQ